MTSLGCDCPICTQWHYRTRASLGLSRVTARAVVPRYEVYHGPTTVAIWHGTKLIRWWRNTDYPRLPPSDLVIRLREG